MGRELSWVEFAERLRAAGWSNDEILAEIARLLTEEDESGYDGP